MYITNCIDYEHCIINIYNIVHFNNCILSYNKKSTLFIVDVNFIRQIKILL